MRAVVLAVAMLFAGAAPAFADFECAWRAFPRETRAAFTNNMRGADDIANAFRAGGLTEAILLDAMRQCGLAETDARGLGQYIAARAIVSVQSRRLVTEYGLHEDQLQAMVAPASQADRETVVRVTGGERPPNAQVTRERFGRLAEAQGIPASDATATRVALEFIFAQIMVEYLIGRQRGI